jgi:cytochrome c-type biogenesis protein CcmE
VATGFSPFKSRFIVGAALIGAAVSYLVYAGIRTTSMYYFELDEFLAEREAHAGETLRVKGWVRHGTIKWEPSTNELAFELGRLEDPTPGVPVAYRGILPDMFAEGREVVVEGRYRDGALSARQIMTSCPSKYEPETTDAPGGAPSAGS